MTDLPSESGGPEGPAAPPPSEPAVVDPAAAPPPDPTAPAAAAPLVPPPAPVAPPAPPLAPPTYAWEAPPPPPAVGGPGVAGLEFAGVGSRLVAWFLDGLLIGLITTPILAALRGDTGVAVYSVVFVAIDAAYHVLFWTSGWRATLGQRLLKLQVGEAATGRTLTTTEATRRWIALGSPLFLLGAIPSLSSVGSAIWLVLAVVLLISTGSSPTRQGIHDRFAGSAVVKPAGGGSSAIVLGCLIVLCLLFLVFVLGIIAVILDPQFQEILSAIGRSI